MSLITRTLVTIVATLAAATIPGAAHAAHRYTGYQPPESVTYVRTVCEQTSPDDWNITHVWRVQGGRYANLGNPQHPRNDTVWQGGTRRVRFTTTMHADPNAADYTTTAVYAHYTAPIASRSNPATWDAHMITREIDLDCG